MAGCWLGSEGQAGLRVEMGGGRKGVPSVWKSMQRLGRIPKRRLYSGHYGWEVGVGGETR